MEGVKDKVAIVTGASRGIGRATAMELARQGAHVVVAARSQAAIDELAQELQGYTPGLAQACDIASFEQTQALVGRTVSEFGRLDALVNNAGVLEPIAPLAQTDPAVWSRNININLVGTYNMCRAALDQMQPGGTLVNLSSGAAHKAMEGWSAYCAAKAGVAMLARSLALETDVTVVSLAPGLVDTEMQASIRASGINEISRIPRDRLSPPGEVARAIAWLCSGAAVRFNGQDVDIRDPDFRRRAGLEDRS